MKLSDLKVGQRFRITHSDVKKDVRVVHEVLEVTPTSLKTKFIECAHAPVIAGVVYTWNLSPGHVDNQYLKSAVIIHPFWGDHNDQGN